MKKQFNNLKKIFRKNMSIIAIIVILLAVLYFMNKETFFQDKTTTTRRCLAENGWYWGWGNKPCKTLENYCHEKHYIDACCEYERKCAEYDEKHSTMYKEEENCGDGVVQSWEECDDGNNET